MKRLIYYLFFVALLASSKNAGATSIFGAEIAYKSVGNDSFDLILKIYRDCNGLPISPSPITVKAGCKTTNYTPTFVSATDITGINPFCGIQSRCTGSYQYGFMQEIYKVRVLLNDTCCNYTLSWGQCCRSGAITTGQAAYDFYTETSFNKCLASVNSSPEFTEVPKILLPHGTDILLDNGATDADADSLSYEMVTPFSGAGSAIPYNGNYNIYKPLTFLGFPNTNLSKPAGFHFDATKGTASFRPTRLNEVCVIAVRVTEWRLIGGVYTKIGDVIRDVTHIIMNGGNNKVPYFTGLTTPNIPVCNTAGTYCFDFTANDADSTDTLNFNFVHNFDSVVITNVGTAARPVMRVCITFSTAELTAGNPLDLRVKVMDNSCPLGGKAEKIFTFKTGTHMPDSFAINKQLICRNLGAQLQNNSSFSGTLTTAFEITSANNTYTANTANQIVVDDVKESGWHNIKMVITSNAFCDSRTYYDSVYVPQSNFMSVNIGKDSSVCFDSSFFITPTITNGNAPFNYQWSNGDSLAAITKTLALGTNHIRLTLTDSAGCIAQDTVMVKYYNPTVILNGDTAKCVNDSITLTATLSNTNAPVFQWAGFATGQTSIKTKLTASKQFVFTLADNSGCLVTQTHNVFASMPQTTHNHNHSQCVGDSIRLSATATGGLGTHTINWPLFSLSGETIVLNPSQSAGKIYFYTVVTDDLGCQSTKNDSVEIHALPVINVTAPGAHCQNTGLVSLAPLATPTGGTWSGTSVAGSDFNTGTSGAGSFMLKYAYTDPTTGCAADKSTQITVDAAPVADFISSTTTGNKPLLVGLFNTTSDTNATWNWIIKDSAGAVVHTSTQRHTNYTFTTEGKYTVILVATNGSCVDTIEKTDVVVVTTNVGIGELSPASIKIYPNPASAFVVVEADVEITSVQITDALGRTWITPTTIEGRKATLNTEGLSAATYLLKITTADGKQGIAQIAVLR